jgi:phospholipase/carboxylesterase
MATKIDGPRVAAKSRVTKQLVVLLHGYGADGNDLIALAEQWQHLLPDAAFVSPHAPERCAQSPRGRQWFALTMRDLEERWVGVEKARPVLDAFLDAECARHGLDEGKVALVGFSQGTMLALHVGLRRARTLGAILGYSGALVGPEHLAPELARAPSRKPPPILLVHGSEDDLIPPDSLFLSAADLAAAGIACQWHFSVGLGHGIDGAGLTHGGRFLANCFGSRPARAVAARA